MWRGAVGGTSVRFRTFFSFLSLATTIRNFIFCFFPLIHFEGTLFLSRASSSFAYRFCVHAHVMRDGEVETPAAAVEAADETKAAGGEGEEKRGRATMMPETSTSDRPRPLQPQPNTTTTSASAAGGVAAAVAAALSAEPELAQLSAVQNST